MNSSQTSRANAVHARVVLAALIVLFACGLFEPGVEVEVLSPRQYDPVPPDSVRVYRRGPPSSAYEPIANLIANESAPPGILVEADTEDVIRALQKKAGSLGANAIVIQQLVPKVEDTECPGAVASLGVCTQTVETQPATGRALAIRIRQL